MGFIFMAYEINFCETKEQLKHLGEVVTGKADGSPTGADIETSTLDYTGQVRETLTALLQKIGLIHTAEWSTNPLVTKSTEVIPYAGTNQLFRPLSLPYQVDSATHPDPNALLPNPATGYAGELVDVSDFVGTQELAIKIAEGTLTFKSVQKMLDGNPVTPVIGDVCCTGGTLWQKESNNGDIFDYKALTEVCIFDFEVKGDFSWDTKTGTDDSDKIQDAIDMLGVFGEQTDNPIQDTARHYTIVFPDAFYYGTKTLYCDYHNLNVDMRGSYVLDADGIAGIDFDFTRSRRPGKTEVKSAAAYKRKIKARAIKLDRRWTAANPSPTKYDRIVLNFSGNVSENDTFKLNNRVYTFKLSKIEDTDVLIGASMDETIDNAVIALDDDPDNFCAVSRTANQLVIEKGASYLTSGSVSSVITDDKFTETDQGVLFGNTWDSDIWIDEASNFCIAYDFISSGSVVGGFGMETNRIRQGRIDDCQVGGRFRQTDGSYHHDSVIEKGNWKVSGPAGRGTSHYGFVFDNIRASNNSFFWNDHEPTTPIGNEETPTYLFIGRAFRNRTQMSRGERATLIARLENGEIDPAPTANTDLGPMWNDFIAGYENLQIEDNSRIKENYTSRNAAGRYSTNQQIASAWNVNVTTRNNIYDACTVTVEGVQVLGWQFCNMSDLDSSTYKRSGSVSVDFANRALTVTNQAAICVGLSSLKGDEEFLISGDVHVDAGRPFVRVFDVNGDPITSRDSVIGSNGDIGNLYRMVYDSASHSWTTLGQDQTNQMYQRVRLNNPDIAFAYIGVKGGSNPAKIRTLKIYARQDAVAPRVIQNFEGVKDDDGQIYVQSAPQQSPTRNAGTIYFNELDNIVGNKIQIGWKRNQADNGYIELWSDTSS